VVALIVKLGETLKWKSYKRRTHFVKAIQMKEDFLYETERGWVQGHKGQWLVESEERVRHAYDHPAFLRVHRAANVGRRKSEE